jgi:acetylornithine deacetylase
MKIDRDYLFATLRELIQINSVNPTLAGSGKGEAEIADYVARALEGLGLEVHRFEPEPGRISVTGTRRGSGGGKSLMLNAHYDTVGIEGMEDPFSGKASDGKMFGRGAYDMKGSLAAQMAAVKALCDSGTELRGDMAALEPRIWFAT